MNDPRPLTVAVCTPRYTPQVGGAETWLRGVIGGLASRGHRVVVLAASASGVPSSSTIEGVEVRRAAPGRTAFARHIASAIRELRPDVVMSQYSATPPAVWAAHRAGVPSVAIVHDVYGFRESVRIKGGPTGTLRWLGLERSMRVLRPDAYLVNSRSTAGLLEPAAGGRAITVVPAGADHLPAHTDATSEAERSGLVFVGRLVPRKGVADLIEAVRILRSRGVEATATIVGDGPDGARLRALADDVGDSVRFTGRVDDDELESAIRGAAALVLPSTREGWGLAITESAARGTPYVAYDIPAVREQHERLKGGLLVRPGTEALTDAIESLLADPSEARRLGEHGRAVAASMRWVDSGVVVERAILDAITARRR